MMFYVLITTITIYYIIVYYIVGAAPAVYNLYAVANHSGTTFGGHYTAYAKNPNSGAWHSFNDQR